MATHATITLKLGGEPIHANMLADGYPSEFGETLRALASASSADPSAVAPMDLRDAFFAPIESDPSSTPESLKSLLNPPSERFDKTERPDWLGDAWYRYELDEVGGAVQVTAYHKNNGPDGRPSLDHGWGRIFRGSLEEFFAWAQQTSKID